LRWRLVREEDQSIAIAFTREGGYDTGLVVRSPSILL
jgi:hypothetical protein